jgi:PAS domain S-box-containing protein
MIPTRILVVEDEAIISEDLQGILIKLGYVVVAAVSTGQQAIEKALELKPDLILMDIMLKDDIDGIQAAQIINSTENIPIIFVTAFADDQTLKRAKISEPYGYILKPFEERELNTNIQIAVYKHKTERELKERERWLATTLRSIGDAVISTNINGKITFMNPVAESLTGFQLNEVLDKNFNKIFKILNAQSETEIGDLIAMVLKKIDIVNLGQGSLLVTKDNKKIPIEDSAAPIKNEKGEIEGVVFIFRDVTEKKKSESELIKLSRAIEQSNASIIITDPEGIVEYVNTKYLDSSEKVHQYIIGNKFYLFEEGELSKQRLAELWDNIKEGYTWKGEFVNLGKSGKMQWESITVSPIFNNDKAINNLVIVKEDITERKRAEEAIRKYNEELKELNRSKDKFFSIVSHDLRSPFNGLLGMANLLASEFDSLANDELKSIADSLNSTANHLFKYIENLLEWSRLQSGKMVHQPVKVDLCESIVYMLKILSPNILQKNISVEYHLKDNSFVLADSNMINSILDNLISNAIKFTMDSGKIYITTEEQGMFIKTSIADTGVGIKEENLKKLFTLRSQYSTEGTSGERGTGLGLLICKEMVEMNGGKILVESKINVGTTFYFTLPIYNVSKQNNRFKNNKNN